MFPMNEQSIGANIRVLRERAGLTLTALAARAGMAKSALSKIETGRISSPISNLLRIAAALNVSISEFFVEVDPAPAYVLTRKGKGPVISRDGSQWGYTYEVLASGMKEKLGEPFILTIRPGDREGRFQHGGEEFIYMLSGGMEFTINGTPLRLMPGDSLYFNPAHVHTTRIIGRKPARFICVFLQGGEGAPPPARGARSVKSVAKQKGGTGHVE